MSAPLSDESEWIQAARRGDAGAWERLVQTYQQPVFRLAYLLLGDPDDAEDVAQETFLRAQGALGSFDPTRPLRPWLMRIAARLASNWRRSAGRYLHALQALLRSSPPPESAPQKAEQKIEAELLRQAIRRLGQADQQVLYLRFFLDFSEAEAAEVLGLPVGTLKSRQHRALARLRGVLQKDFPQLSGEETHVP